MPVRKRLDKRRPSFRLDDWEEFLSTGADGFGDLKWAGIVPDFKTPPPRELAEAAWRVLGTQVVAEHGADCWGAREFG